MRRLHEESFTLLQHRGVRIGRRVCSFAGRRGRDHVRRIAIIRRLGPTARRDEVRVRSFFSSLAKYGEARPDPDPALIHDRALLVVTRCTIAAPARKPKKIFASGTVRQSGGKIILEYRPIGFFRSNSPGGAIRRRVFFGRRSSWSSLFTPIIEGCKE